MAAIEEAFSLLDAGEAGLHDTRTRLKRMRDSVLAAAVTGQLVPQDPTDTPADRFVAEHRRRRRWQAAGLLPIRRSWTWALVRDVGARLTLGRQRPIPSGHGTQHEALPAGCNVVEAASTT